ncbi:MAG: AMP-binding protein [Desulfobacterales bacterium]|nr:AMP-binding protein [Desulfobacterales bacterium]
MDSKHGDQTGGVNVSVHLTEMAEKHPWRRAVVMPAGRDRANRVLYVHYTFRQLDRAADRIAHGLSDVGIGRGTRTIVMVGPSLDFFALTFAMFKVGAVPVMVDPGMGVGRMLSCLQESRPEGFVGIPKAHVLRSLRPRYFRSVNTWITVGRRWFWGGYTLTEFQHRPWKPYPAAPTARNETAAILFTTGSTGPAKGVVYTHGMFDAQVRAIGDRFGIEPGEIDLPTFPLFALFAPALGMTAVIPDMNPTRPARVDPAKIVEAVENHGVTNMFASPALLHRVGADGKQRKIKLASVSRVISAGAPTLPANVAQFAEMLTGDTQIHSGYGATEAMPVSSIGSREILSETGKMSEQGRGTCVGTPLSGMEVRIIEISDDPIPEWSEALCLPDGKIGEIAVKGAVVSRGYFERPKDDALSKIRDKGSSWHRMGDVGWRDEKGRIWFCGRKGHRVQTETGPLFTIPCEAIFNRHPDVLRSALVGVGRPGSQTPVICIEPEKKLASKRRAALRAELLDLARGASVTARIETVLFHPAFPVDIRHNSKIFREKLAVWAEKKIRRMPKNA